MERKKKTGKKDKEKKKGGEKREHVYKKQGLGPVTMRPSYDARKSVAGGRASSMHRAPVANVNQQGEERKGKHGASFSVTYLDSLDTTRDRALFSSFSFLFSALIFSNCWKKENEQSWEKRWETKPQRETIILKTVFCGFLGTVGTMILYCLWVERILMKSAPANLHKTPYGFIFTTRRHSTRPGVIITDTKVSRPW